MQPVQRDATVANPAIKNLFHPPMTFKQQALPAVEPLVSVSQVYRSQLLA